MDPRRRPGSFFFWELIVTYGQHKSDGHTSIELRDRYILYTTTHPVSQIEGEDIYCSSARFSQQRSYGARYAPCTQDDPITTAIATLLFVERWI